MCVVVLVITSPRNCVCSWWLTTDWIIKLTTLINSL